ncbi:cytochrome P450 [Solicola sp. PLA-1-18]|uniref:cytochrome P450 n=1 Tax=Solicola sp. PLA-1-18 TaxID=3380532 RepID=UPI003B803F2E
MTVTREQQVADVPTGRGLPPGPRWPAVVQTVAFLRYRHRFVPWLHRRYGDNVTLRVLPGPRAVVLFRRPEEIKEIFAGDPADFHAGEGNAILGPVMGAHSVLLTDEAVHLRARKLLMPAFNGASLRGYRELVQRIAAGEASSWRGGQQVVGLDRMNAVTLEIILQVVFGVTDEQRLARMRPMVNRMVDISTAMLLGWTYPRLFSVGPWKRYFDNQRALDAILYDEIAQRRRATDLDERDDVLSRLLRVGGDGDAPLSDAELRDQLVTLLLAGHETTASALAWTLHELAMNPDVQAEAHRAADTGDEAFLEACLKEAMRVHPIIDQVARKLKRPRTVAGWDVPRNATVSPSIRLAHSSDESFGDAGRYRPRRFLDEQVAPNTWIPFGGGVRRCIGAGFSLMEGTVVLREVLTRFEVSVDAPERERLRNITTVPRSKAPLTLRAR